MALALNDLNHAGNDWAGDKWQAVGLVNQAIPELDEGERAAVAAEYH